MGSAQRFAELEVIIRRELEFFGRVVARIGLAAAEPSDPAKARRRARSLADMLRGVYSVAENIFEPIAEHIDRSGPDGRGWHGELLESMSLQLAGMRPPVLTPDTVRRLREYLHFRQSGWNRSGPGFEWARLRPLVERLGPTWVGVRDDVTRFASFLDASARTDEFKS